MAKANLGTPTKASDLADRLADPEYRAAIEEGVRNMPPERALELIQMLEDSLRRRKLELFGYLAAAAMLLIGMTIAIYVYGSSEPGEFVGWVFLLPLSLAGAVMMVVGRWARKTKKEAPAVPAPPKAPPRT